MASTLSVPASLFVIPVHELHELLFPLGITTDTKWSKREVGSTIFRLAKEQEGSGIDINVRAYGDTSLLYDRYNPGFGVLDHNHLTTAVILPTSPNHRLCYELIWWRNVPEDKAKGKFPVRGMPVHMFKEGTLTRTKEFRALKGEVKLLRTWDVI